MNEWRVDRTDDKRAPCGMNSIRYIGESRFEAELVYLSLRTGLDHWDRPNDKYGVLLSRWSISRNDYVAVKFKLPPCKADPCDEMCGLPAALFEDGSIEYRWFY